MAEKVAALVGAAKGGSREAAEAVPVEGATVVEGCEATAVGAVEREARGNH